MKNQQQDQLCLEVVNFGLSDVQLVRDCGGCTGETGRVAPQQWTRTGSLSSRPQFLAGTRGAYRSPTATQ